MYLEVFQKKENMRAPETEYQLIYKIKVHLEREDKSNRQEKRKFKRQDQLGISRSNSYPTQRILCTRKRFTATKGTKA